MRPELHKVIDVVQVGQEVCVTLEAAKCVREVWFDVLEAERLFSALSGVLHSE